MRVLNYNGILTVINTIRLGNKLPVDLIPKRTLYRYVNLLKKEDIIRKLGAGTWELTGKKFDIKNLANMPKRHYRQGGGVYKRVIRGHGFIVTFELPKISGWYKRAEFFKKHKLNALNLKYGHRITLKGYKLHIFKNTVVIYSPANKSYFSDNAADSYRYAIYDVLEVFKTFENMIGVPLTINKSYKFKVSRQHYAKIKDNLAKMYKRNGEKLEIRNGNGETWLITDNSLNLEELETVHKETAKTDMDKVIIPFFNDLKDHYEKTGETLRLTDFLIIHAMMAENVKTHFKLLEDIKNEIHNFAEKVKEIK